MTMMMMINNNNIEDRPQSGMVNTIEAVLGTQWIYVEFVGEFARENQLIISANCHIAPLITSSLSFIW